MALGSKKRDYKTEYVRTRDILKRHNDRMLELMKNGLTKGEAGKKAYNEIKKREV